MRRPRVITTVAAALTAAAISAAPAGAVDYTLREFTAGIGAGASPQDIVVDADGRAWFTEPGIDKVGVASALGVLGESPLPVEAGPSPRAAMPHSIARGFDERLWFTEPGRDMIGAIDRKTGVVTEYPVAPGAAPLDIARGPDGELGMWFTEPGLRQIGRIAMDGTVQEWPSGASGTPTNIAKGPDGMYFTMPDINAVGRIYTDSHIVTRVTTGITPGAAPLDIAMRDAGHMWFTEPGIAGVGIVESGGSVMTVVEQPLGTFPGSPTAFGGTGLAPLLSAGPGDVISRLRSTGAGADTVAMTPAPTAGSTPTNIASTSSPDKFWFTQPGQNGIAYVFPTPPPPPPPPPAPPAPPAPRGNPNLELELESEEATPVVIKATPAKKAVNAGRRRRCYVPRLRLRTINGARKILKKNRCRVGKITRKGGKSRKGRRFRVIKQSKKVHLRTTFNTKVNFTVAPRKAPKPKKRKK